MRTAIYLTVAALVLASCKKDASQDSAKQTSSLDCSTVTDTYPQFCGKVPTNLLFISIDTFRKDSLARYGGDPELTPTLDQLAATGVVLDDNVQVSNWTFHGTSATLMGQTAVDAGWMPHLVNPEFFPGGYRTLPSYLEEEDYWSVLVSSNGWLSENWGNGRDYSEVIFPGGSMLGAVTNNGLVALDAARSQGLADKWFMHLHALEPHAPYIPADVYLDDLSSLEPIPWDLTEQANHYASTAQWGSLTDDEQDLLLEHLWVRYRGEVRSTDDGIAGTLNRLDTEGLLDDTLLVIWTDHGEQFYEHGAQTHAHHLYGEENDALAMFWAKNIVPAVHAGPTQSVDIVPTLLKLWGMEIPENMDGVPLGEGTDDRVRFTAADVRQGTIQAVIRNGYKLQFYWRSGGLVLTNQTIDPTEAPLDLDANATLVHELWELLEPRAQKVVAIKGIGPSGGWPDLPALP